MWALGNISNSGMSVLDASRARSIFFESPIWFSYDTEVSVNKSGNAMAIDMIP